MNLIKKFTDKTFFKFIIVGIINTVVGTAIMFILYNVFNFSYEISSGANYFFTSILSYFLNKYFTFKSKEKSVSEIIRFALNIIVCYVLAYGIAKRLAFLVLGFLDKRLRENIAMVVGMGLFTILNYFGQRFFSFREKE